MRPLDRPLAPTFRHLCSALASCNSLAFREILATAIGRPLAAQAQIKLVALIEGGREQEACQVELEGLN